MPIDVTSFFLSFFLLFIRLFFCFVLFRIQLLIGRLHRLYVFMCVCDAKRFKTIAWRSVYNSRLGLLFSVLLFHLAREIEAFDDVISTYSRDSDRVFVVWHKKRRRRQIASWSRWHKFDNDICLFCSFFCCCCCLVWACNFVLPGLTQTTHEQHSICRCKGECAMMWWRWWWCYSKPGICEVNESKVTTLNGYARTHTDLWWLVDVDCIFEHCAKRNISVDDAFFPFFPRNIALHYIERAYWIAKSGMQTLLNISRTHTELHCAIPSILFCGN